MALNPDALGGLGDFNSLLSGGKSVAGSPPKSSQPVKSKSDRAADSSEPKLKAGRRVGAKFGPARQGAGDALLAMNWHNAVLDVTVADVGVDALEDFGLAEFDAEVGDGRRPLGSTLVAMNWSNSERQVAAAAATNGRPRKQDHSVAAMFDGFDW